MAAGRWHDYTVRKRGDELGFHESDLKYPKIPSVSSHFVCQYTAIICYIFTLVEDGIRNGAQARCDRCV